MADHKSAIKKTRHDESKRVVNKNNRSRMRTAIKKFRVLIESGKMEDIQKAYPEVVAIIDKTETKGIIHKNAAARYKSRLFKAMQKTS